MANLWCFPSKLVNTLGLPWDCFEQSKFGVRIKPDQLANIRGLAFPVSAPLPLTCRFATTCVMMLSVFCLVTLVQKSSKVSLIGIGQSFLSNIGLLPADSRIDVSPAKICLMQGSGYSFLMPLKALAALPQNRVSSCKDSAQARAVCKPISVSPFFWSQQL